MAKRLVITDEFLADVDRIVEFNDRRNRSDTYSKKFLHNLDKRLILLQTQPSNGRPTGIKNELLLVWDKYYIFYENNDLGLIIKSIYHQRENIR